MFKGQKDIEFYLYIKHDKPDSIIVIYCFSTNHAVLRSNSKVALARSLDNVAEWSHMSSNGQLFK